MIYRAVTDSGYALLTGSRQHRAIEETLVAYAHFMTKLLGMGVDRHGRRGKYLASYFAETWEFDKLMCDNLYYQFLFFTVIGALAFHFSAKSIDEQPGVIIPIIQ